ncbi:DUF2207 family protein [Lysinimonas soli]|uniref:DUF2207 family protein n=1 Tax=Lysinimonas soli TaxID=1074233 RepID=A0ABW0NLG1_9MICO
MIRRLLSFAALAALLGLALGVGSAPAPARAGVDDFSFESLTADYYLGRDAAGYSTLRTVETIVALFPDYDQNRGIVRAIPTFDTTTRVEEDVQIVKVTDGNGAPVHYETSRDGDFLDVSLGTDAYVHGRTRYVIEYTQKYAAHYFTDTKDDEFYWDVNGNGWAQTFGQVTARIHLENGIGAKLTGHASCYVGAYGDTGSCTIDRTADGYALSVQNVGAYQTATFAIGFAPHTFRPGPTANDDARAAVLPWVLLALLAAIALLIVCMRLFVWRDHPGRGIIVARYEAPDGIGVMQSAELLHRGNAGLPAEFVNFAVLGAAHLLEEPEEDPDRRYRLQKLDREVLKVDDDRRAFDALFALADRADVLTLDRSDEKLGDAIAKLQGEVRASLRTRKYLVGRRSAITVALRLLLVVVLGASVYDAIWGGSASVAGALFFWQMVVLIVGSLIAIGFAGAPERLTAQGAEARDQLLGIRDYLQLAEADRLRMLQSPTGAERTSIDPSNEVEVVKLYERLLPWAMVWGIEAQWAKVLGAHYATTPVQTTGVQFASTGFLLGLDAFSHSMQPGSFARTPPPTSSGGSWGSSGGSSFGGGSFGGGFSGGGFGGGGGGGR